MRLACLIPLLLVGFITLPHSESTAGNDQRRQSRLYNANEWVDSVYQSLTLQEKIGQLMMVAAYSNKSDGHRQHITNLVQKYSVGGLIFFQGSPSRQLKLTNTYQKKADVPLLIGMDAEWGLSMRLDSTMAFPKQMTLGAVQDKSLIKRMGQHIGRQCRRLGVHINFAPVVDVNNNPQNPVIHMRSFGEEPKSVANKAQAYLTGLQQEGVLAVAKHFPGHGDTDQDSHESLPVLGHDKDRLYQTELLPFRAAIDENVGGVMSGHLAVPAITGVKQKPASLSSILVEDLLKDSMRFDGLVFTDALNMKGVTQKYGPSQVPLQALKAGNDVLLYPEAVPKAIQQIKQAIEKNELSLKKVEKKVKAILQTKYWAGLSKWKPLKSENLKKDLHKPKAVDVKDQLIEEAMTLVTNKKDLVPFKNLERHKMAAVSFAQEAPTAFFHRLKQYASIQTIQMEHDAGQAAIKKLKERLRNYNTIIISIHDQNAYDVQDFGLKDRLIENVNEIGSQKRSVLVNFGSPYALRLFNPNNHHGVLQAYEDGKSFWQGAAKALFGGIPLRGQLPVTVEDRYQEGTGLKTGSAIRLNYTLPERVGISSSYLKTHLDSLVQRAINKKATPGCQLLVAKQGNVIYNKSYGHFTYDSQKVVKPSSIYDIASITKIGATVPIAMQLYEKGSLHLDSTLGYYMDRYLDTIKRDLRLRELFTHQAGLKAWIPFYRYTLNEKGFCDSNYCYNPNSFFSLQVADDLFLQRSYRDSIWQMISDSKIEGRGSYNYSDLGFFYLKKVLEQFLQVPFEKYVQHHFYDPLGMRNTSFLPLRYFPLSRIVPTEKDDYFRHQLIHGYVHDPAAAMLGGVAGHAGIFSNVNDFAKIMQMFLNNGKYGGKRYFKGKTIELFTSQQYEDNRKGLGFDKPQMDPDKISPTSHLATKETFGHTGFTGTCVWADPRHDLIYAFFSNRVHPTMENDKLVSMDVRTDIQDFIYRSFLSEEEIESRKHRE